MYNLVPRGRNPIGRWYGMCSSILARIRFRQRIIPERSFPSQESQAWGTRLISVLLNTCSFVMQVEYSQAYSPACERDHLTSNVPGQLVRITELAYIRSIIILF